MIQPLRQALKGRAKYFRFQYEYVPTLEVPMNILQQYGLTDRFTTEAANYPDLTLGRVIAQYRGLYKIVTETGEHPAEISGKLRYETDELAKYPAVGDFVMVSVADDPSPAIIHHILTRKSVFMRKAVGLTDQAQPVAANIDIVFICMALNKNYNLSRLERYLAVAWDSGAKPVILLTKADLCQDLPEAIAEAERVSLYSDVIALSAFDADLPEKLAPYFAEGVTTAFIGSSGVGKSTLINRLLGESMILTAETGRDDKGRHTTTGREMIPCPLGGVVIDTPGMRELGADSADLSRAFADIDELSRQCRFSDCSHTSEPGCRVLQALEDGLIDQRRLDNYFKLKHEAGYEGLTSREIESKKLDRMFKDVGGIKGARSIAKGNKRK